jgi:spore germination cell wall hydrolase CwlJ-like protein
MDPAALAGLCAVLVSGKPTGPLPTSVSCPSTPVLSAQSAKQTTPSLAVLLKAPAARDGLARVAFAEAANQGDSGLAAVVYAILNRLADGRWGATMDAVLNAPHQFEPVMRAGGDWRNLPPATVEQRARIDTIVNLVLDGCLPDLTHGARFFQNPVVVGQRARDGVVATRLVNFGGAVPTAVIGAHSFYADAGRGGGDAGHFRAPLSRAKTDTLFVGDNRAGGSSKADRPGADEPATPDPMHGLFVGADGLSKADGP